MYSNSKAKIKLINKVSESMEVLTGTEQGHPMSPELFKCYLLELSEDLNKTANVESPELHSARLTHLLWGADDLVLLALDRRSLQKLIETVHTYCCSWGSSVNMGKTAVLVFNNKSGRQLKVRFELNHGSTKILSGKEFCYLGSIFSLSGSLTKAQDELRKKGLRAYFSLKNTVDVRNLSIKSLFRLFDSLIVPVFTYGCQIWLFDTNLVKMVASNTLFKDNKTSLNNIASDHTERIHLKFVKWTLGLSTRASHLPCWGDTGRLPIAITCIKQALNYIKRLESLKHGHHETLAGNALIEQENLSLPWFKRLRELQEQLGMNRSLDAAKFLESKFERLWTLAMPRVLHAFCLKGGHFEVKEGHPDFFTNNMIFLNAVLLLYLKLFTC